jgi:hypothetical protein
MSLGRVKPLKLQVPEARLELAQAGARGILSASKALLPEF